MKINHEATYDRCRIINRVALAKMVGVSKAVVSQVITGAYPAMSSHKAQIVVAKLRELDLLVEEPDKAA